MEERRRGERRKADRRVDIEGAKNHSGMERRLAERRITDRRRPKISGSDA
jgi:hypothetical protein